MFCNQFYLSWTRILHNIFTGRSGPKKCLMDNLGPTFSTDYYPLHTHPLMCAPGFTCLEISFYSFKCYKNKNQKYIIKLTIKNCGIAKNKKLNWDGPYRFLLFFHASNLHTWMVQTICSPAWLLYRS